MISLLLIISFLLHIIAIFGIYQLYKQLQVVKQEDSSDVIELFETYLQEIKDENNRLQVELSGKVSQEKTESPQQPEMYNKKQTTSENEKVSNYKPPENQMDDSVEASLQARILQLYNEGLQETEIAQKLNCGKTEVALIIKLHG